MSSENLAARVDLNLFVVFDEIHRQRSVSKAARALHVSQPAISHSLARLREALGDPLFVRRGNAMVPTVMARSMIGSVQRALQLLRETVGTARSFDPARAECDFRLGFRDALESLAFPTLLAELGAGAPGVRIASHRVAHGAVEQALTTGRADLVVDVAVSVGDHIRHQRVCLEPLTVVVRDSHELAGGIGMDDYVGARHVLVTLLPGGPELVDVELGKVGLARNIALRCQHYFAAAQVVAATDMIITMPSSHAAVLAELLPLALVPPPLDIPPLDVRMFWHRDAEHEPANRWLRETMDDVLRRTIQRSRSAIAGGFGG